MKEKLLIKKRDACLAGGKENMLPQGLAIRESVRLWMEENQTKWKESHFATYRSIAEKHILPVIGRQAVSGFDEEAWRVILKACADRPAQRRKKSCPKPIFIRFSSCSARFFISWGKNSAATDRSCPRLPPRLKHRFRSRRKGANLKNWRNTL
ncbi:MAG: hypothetical protein ACLVAW_20960 [Eisenbergiella massiliensis]